MNATQTNMGRYLSRATRGGRLVGASREVHHFRRVNFSVSRTERGLRSVDGITTTKIPGHLAIGGRRRAQSVTIFNVVYLYIYI